MNSQKDKQKPFVANWIKITLVKGFFFASLFIFDQK